MDPQKRVSWLITYGVAAFFTLYLGKLYLDGDFEPPPQPNAHLPTGVRKVLPDGRHLMDDGRIVQPKPER